jgi:hypothetical protein
LGSREQEAALSSAETTPGNALVVFAVPLLSYWLMTYSVNSDWLIGCKNFL